MCRTDYSFIRKFSGGFHAKKAWVCLICSSTLLVFCTIVSSYIEYGLGLAMVTLAAITILVLCSPIDSESRRLSQEEKKSCKIATIIMTFFFRFYRFDVISVSEGNICRMHFTRNYFDSRIANSMFVSSH